jgi:hypothetical protein
MGRVMVRKSFVSLVLLSAAVVALGCSAKGTDLAASEAAGTGGAALLPASGGTAGVGGQPGVGGTLPGVGGTDPGVGGTLPGVGGTLPGVGGTDPGVGGTLPGVGGTDPGVGGTLPGVGGTPGGGGLNENPTGSDVVLDNMEDGDHRVNLVQGRGGYWYSYNSGDGTQTPAADPTGLGATPFTMTPGGANGSAYAAHTSGSGFPATGYAGIGFNFTDPMGSYDLSACSGIGFLAKGSAFRVRLPTPATQVDYDDFGAVVTPGADWTSHEILWTDLTQEGWGTPTTFDPAQVLAIQFQAASAATFDFWVDEIELVGCDLAPSCNDGIQNQGEADIDCGGPCPACIVPPSCGDGACNGTETCETCELDCGACGTAGRYEAEDAVFVNANAGADVAASGGAYVDGNEGASLLWTVDFAGGTATLSFATRAINRSMGVFVNGVRVGSITTTTDRPTWAVQTVTATLAAGTNTIELRDTEGAAEPDVDYLEVDAATSATCNDGIQNQGEAGIDCGGPCPACVVVPTCNDGIQNQSEAGVDCGGPCPACVVVPTCNDGVKNGTESDVDCGGSCANKCAVGKICTVAADCQTAICTAGTCRAAPSCNDGIQNQGETGIDCGGSCPACGGACNKSMAVWTTTDIYGKYNVGQWYTARNNVWGGDRPGFVQGESMWVASERCWGATAAHQEANGLVKSFPNLLRGWATWDGYIRQNTGLPVKLSEMTKALIYWKMSAPNTPGGRYQGLWDIYLHTIPNPGATQLSHTNLQIFQQIYDPSGYAQGEAARGAAKTYGGINFKMNIINGPTMSSTNKVITLFMAPFTGNTMGVAEARIDLMAVLNGLKADGTLDPNLYLTSIQPGWEIIGAGEFVTLDYWTALQNDPTP